MSYRHVLTNLGVSVVSVLVFLLVAEVVLRFLPVNESLVWEPVNAAHPVQHFAPNRNFLWSLGWDFSVVNRGRTNNAGYVNDQDYSTDDSRPLLAVIGDSYIEALMVPFRETLQGRLAADGGRVYSFAASGAPLSQYLIWAREAVERYRAGFMVINVVGNDFDESILKYRGWPGGHYYVPAADGTLVLKRVDYEPSPLHRLLRRSALMRYLVFNLKVTDVPATLEGLGAAGRATYGNTAAGPERLSESRQAVDAFLRDLPAMTGLPPDRVLLLVDGLRYPDLVEKAAGSYFVRMRTYLIEQASRHGFEVIDLDPLFFADFRRNHQLFHIPEEGHWNSRGHAVAADAVRSSALYAAFRAATAAAR
ncbi:MAG: hypothetical protein GC151_16535 [Betaproteobacteria bacterium]|nr:hypothetical protein [Betaproteobacteria bacterium]